MPLKKAGDAHILTSALRVYVLKLQPTLRGNYLLLSRLDSFERYVRLNEGLVDKDKRAHRIESLLQLSVQVAF